MQNREIHEEEDFAVGFLLAELRERTDGQQTPPLAKAGDKAKEAKAVEDSHVRSLDAACDRFVGAVQRFTTGEFGRLYELGPVVGRGSTSTVYLTTCRRTGTFWATKVIDESVLRRREWTRLSDQFSAEISALRACRHPHIISLSDAIADVRGSRLYLIFEYLSGGELFDYVIRKGTLNEAEAATILRDVASAIAHMHSRRVIHRDLKPENLLLNCEPPPNTPPNVKIIDFGLSKMLPSDRGSCGVEAADTRPALDHTATSFLGTRGYLAPEMLKRERYSEAVDVWAFGVIAFVLVCGCLPFNDDLSQINSPVAGRMFGTLRYPSWASALSPQAKHFLRHLLEIDPRARLTAMDAAQHAWLRPEAHIPHHILRSPALIKDRRRQQNKIKKNMTSAATSPSRSTRTMPGLQHSGGCARLHDVHYSHNAEEGNPGASQRTSCDVDRIHHATTSTCGNRRWYPQGEGSDIDSGLSGLPALVCRHSL